MDQDTPKLMKNINTRLRKKQIAACNKAIAALQEAVKELTVLYTFVQPPIEPRKE